MSSNRVPRQVRQPPGLTEDRATRLALAYLSRRDRTAAQLAQYLSKKGVSSAMAEGVLRRFLDLGYLNDHAFARRWAEDRLRKQPMGAARLRAELLAKGVGESEVVETLADLYAGDVERTLAMRLLAGEQRKALSPAKLAARLRQRGFDEDTIDHVVRRSGLDLLD